MTKKKCENMIKDFIKQFYYYFFTKSTYDVFDKIIIKRHRQNLLR